MEKDQNQTPENTSHGDQDNNKNLDVNETQKSNNEETGEKSTEVSPDEKILDL